MKCLLTFLLLLPAATSAQSGVILFDRAVRYDFEVPEAWEEMRDRIPSANFTYMLLLFNESASLMTPAPPDEEEEPQEGTDRRARGMVQRLRRGSPSRSDQENLREVYVNNEDGTIAETREFLGRTFLISGTRPVYAWKLSGEHSEFLGYQVHKATTVLDSSVIEAWFTPEIPVASGPALFGGLPGMILSVSIDDGQTVYSATEITLTSVEDDTFKAPEDGEEVSPSEYEEIVAEKLEELKLRRRGRRRRP